jgi:hypothetical protein
MTRLPQWLEVSSYFAIFVLTRLGLHAVYSLETLPDIRSQNLTAKMKVRYDKMGILSDTFCPTFNIHFQRVLKVRQRCEVLLWHENVEVKTDFDGTCKPNDCSSSFYSYQKASTEKDVDSSRFVDQSYQNPKIKDSYHSENFTTTGVRLNGVNAELSQNQIETISDEAPWIPVRFARGATTQIGFWERLLGRVKKRQYVIDISKPGIGVSGATKVNPVEFDQKKGQRAYIVSKRHELEIPLTLLNDEVSTMNYQTSCLQDGLDVEASVGDVRCFF